MDLRAALSAATGGLSAIQYQSSVVSANVSNASVDGYTSKTAVTETTVSNGTATGVTVTGVESYVDENLVRSVVDASSDSGRASTVSQYLATLLNAFGTTDSDDTLSDRVTDLENALADLVVTPESDTEKTEVISAAEALATSLNSLSSEVQDLRGQADTAIATTVDDINATLSTIDQLNDQVAAKTDAGQSTADLEDARRQALESLASDIDITYFVNGDNEVQVYTTGGMTLLDGSVHELSYEAGGHLSADTTYPDDLDGIMLDGVDVTTSLSGGTVGALVELRDDTLVDVQAELDEMASRVAGSLNAALNQGTAYPAPNSVTGSASVAGTDAVSATGTLRIAAVDADGAADSVTDLDLSAYATVQDLVDAIDSISGVSAALDGDRHLVISADDADLGIAVNQMDSAVGSDGQGASAYFGLNDLFTGGSAATLSVRADLVDDPSLLATGSLSDDAGAAAGDTVLGVGGTATAEAMKEALASDVDFTAAGGLGASSKTIAEYATAILSDLSMQSSQADSDSETRDTVLSELQLDLSNQSGVNLDEEAARLSDLENHYSAVAQVLTTLNEMYQILLEAVS